MLTIYEMIILVLGSYRLTRCIMHDMPFQWFRNRIFHEETDLTDFETTYLVPNGIIGKLVECQWCLNMIVTMLVYISLIFLPNIFIYVWTVFSFGALASFVTLGADILETKSFSVKK